MKKKSLYFTGPRKVKIREEEIKESEEEEVLIKSKISSISSGTELLLYNDKIEQGTKLDTQIASLKDSFEYPFKYGYSNIGEVISVGKGVSKEWIGEYVFSFHPHETHYIKSVDDLIKVPNNIDIENFSFLPNIETALNFVMDGRPIIGENIIIFGQGVIGLLTTAILNEFPLNKLITVDSYKKRRKMSKKFGSYRAFGTDFDSEDILDPLENLKNGFDLSYEISGNLSALEKAVEVTRYDGRIIIGSWYGNKRKPFNLSTRFHRNRIKIISSQVSTINPNLSGRWDKGRRLDLAIELIKQLNPQDLISHRISFTEAEKAYSLLNNNSEETLQVILEY